MNLARLLSLLVALTPAACGEHEPELGRVGGGAAGGTGGTGGSGGAAGSAGAAGASCTPDPSVVTPALPCEVDAILEKKCRRCHTQPTQNGAPFPLLTWENTQEIYFDDKPRWLFMKTAVTKNFMPFVALKLDPPVEPLEPDEKAALLAWLECALPVEKAQCAP